MGIWKRLVRAAAVAALAVGLIGCSKSDDPPAPPATVTPAITTAPAAATVVAGQTATFMVAATGTPAPTYQWQRNGVDITGATAASYTTTATTVGDSGVQFLVKVSNSAGTATSAVALLTVNPLVAASISAQPTGTTVSTGTATIFSVQAVGTGPFSYQWQRDGADISGATNATYSLPAPTVADSGATFRVVVSNAAGSVTSVGALLTVVSGSVAAPTISAQPQSTTLLDGDQAVLSVAASGTGPFSYQWRRNGTAVAGATTSTFTSDAQTLADTGAVYSVAVTNGGGSVTSSNATVTVNVRPLEFFATPGPETKAPGEAAFFVSLANGSDPKNYQWLKNGTTISGATATTYVTPAVTAADNGVLFSVRVTNPAGSITSPTALLTVTSAPAAPTIATQPANVTVTEGLPATFSVSANGTGTLGYQWRRNGTNISGATTASYTVASTVASDNAARFSVVVSNSTGNVTSADGILTVQAATGPLVGRAWVTGQSLEENTSAVSVLDQRAAIDDAGNVTVLFRKNNGTRDAIYATRGTPNGAGQAPTWTTPAVIDVLAGAPVSTMGTQPDYSLTAAPGGDLVALWYHNAACTAATYRTSGTCRYYYFARYRAASGTWEAPVLLTDAASPGFDVFTNDRGDLVFFGNSWVRSGTTSSSAALALFMRAPTETTTRRQLLNAEPINDYQMGMDAAGNLLMAAQYQQNATTDLVAYRGSVSSGLGAHQVLDSRGAAATLQRAAVGLNGQQVITWTQSNGVKTTTFAATSPTASGTFTVADLDFLPRGSDNYLRLLVTDQGEVLYYDLGSIGSSPKRSRWTNSGGWTSREAIALPSEFAAQFAHNRRGDLLGWVAGCITCSFGLTATYDAGRNVVTMAWPQGRSGPAYVLGFDKDAGYGPAILSNSGVGFIGLLNKFDVLPTPASPAGDGRNVTNLWGVFLK